MRHVESAMIDG